VKGGLKFLHVSVTVWLKVQHVAGSSVTKVMPPSIVFAVILRTFV
jgi:hypothetical protein